MISAPDAFPPVPRPPAKPRRPATGRMCKFFTPARPCVRPRHEDVMKSLLAVVAALVCTTPLFAQGWIEPDRRIRCNGCAVERLRTAVSVHVTGRIARVEVEEWFRNNGGIMDQGDYLYPLPGEAV